MREGDGTSEIGTWPVTWTTGWRDNAASGGRTSSGAGAGSFGLAGSTSRDRGRYGLGYSDLQSWIWPGCVSEQGTTSSSRCVGRLLFFLFILRLGQSSGATAIKDGHEDSHCFRRPRQRSWSATRTISVSDGIVCLRVTASELRLLISGQDYVLGGTTGRSDFAAGTVGEARQREPSGHRRDQGRAGRNLD